MTETRALYILGGALFFVAVARENVGLAVMAGLFLGGAWERTLVWVERWLRVRVPERLRRGW